jgi:serine/threonine protein kinase
MSKDDPGPAGGETLDLLALVRRSGVLADRQFREIRAKVEAGEYPRDPTALADRLVNEGVLTRYQADRLLRNKAHGLVVDRYVILERLGQGGMGRVYKAHHRLMGRIVALKVIAPRYASRARSLARFQREMRLIGRLDHPNIIRAYDANQIDKAFFLVMEYPGGQSLDRVLADRGPLPFGEVVDYAAQAALGLAHAHSQGIVHRDIKPSNLLLTDDRRIKVLDLGLGTLMNVEERTTFATVAGRAIGTIDFMSPEQLGQGVVDGRSDLFGLGCTMYVLLTGRPPFPGETDLERLVRRLKGPPVPITDFRPDLPEAVVQVLGRFLARRPDDRFQTAGEAAEALLALLEDGSPPPEVSHPSTRPAGLPDFHRAPDESSGKISGSAEWSTPSPASSGPSTHNTFVGDLPALAARHPGIALVIVLAFSLAVFFAGFSLGRWLTG